MSKDAGSRPLRVLFVSRGLFEDRDGYQSGFQTRTLAELKAVAGRWCSGRKIEVQLLDFESRRHLAGGRARSIGDMLSAAGIESRLVAARAPHCRSRHLEYLVWALQSLWDSVLVAAAARRWESDVIHTHGEWITFTSIPASKLLRIPLLYEAHGILDEVYRKGEGLGIGYRAVKTLESICMRSSRHLIVVSEAMKDHFARSYDVLAQVVPCGVDAGLFAYDERTRSAMRRELMLTDKYVVVYSGSLFDPWQQPKEMVGAFKEIEKRAPGCVFLVLTYDDTEAVRGLLVSQGLAPSSMLIRRVAHTDVPAHLMAGDVGLLIRARDIVNRVACPVKFAEYLACGVPVLCTRGIGDISDIVKDHDVGLVIDNEMEDVDWDRACEDLSRLRGAGTKERCLRTARDRFSWESNSAAICAFYLEVAGAAPSR